MLLGVRILRFDPVEYRKVHNRYINPKSVLLGKTRIVHGAIPDERFKEGMAIDLRSKTIELNGKVSDEIVNRILR